MISKKGFTLIELMIVISIIGILAAVFVPVCCEYNRMSVGAQEAEEVNSGPIKASPGVIRLPVPDQNPLILRIICVEGHQYYFGTVSDYFTNQGYGRAVLAPKLADNGYPIPCTAEQE